MSPAPVNTFRVRLRGIIEDNTTRWGRIFDYFMQVMIFVSLTGYAFSTMPSLPEPMRAVLRYVELAAVIIFSVEYVLRVYVAEKFTRYMFSFYGFIDFIAVVPFYFTGSSQLLSLRAFRVFRAFKLVRYNRAMTRFSVAARLIKEELALFIMVSGILLFISSSGIYFFGNAAQPEAFSSVFSSAWWAVATLTTVGYGDVYPITIGGKIFTVFILMVGVGIVTIPAGLVASALGQAREIEEEEDRKEREAQQQQEAAAATQLP